MTKVAKALYAFYSQFGIPAYEENMVPDDAKLPYITYSAPQSDVFASATHYARIWYATDKGAPDNTEVNAKADEVIDAIGRGVKLKIGRGFAFIFPGNPFAQPQPAGDGTQIVYLNMELRCYV